MATITFTDGRKAKVDPNKAIKLWFIRTGKKPGSPEILAYLEKVQDISFEAPEPVRLQIRLPYAD